MSQKVNISERILGSSAALQGEIQWQNYIDKSCFTYYCDLIPDPAGEKITIENIQDHSLTEIEGVVYVLVIDGKILTIGRSTKTFEDRVGSYNAGTKSIRKGKGTSSVTNYYILQSLLNINLTVEVYLMAPEHREWEAFGKKGTVSFPPVNILKTELLKRFKKQHGKSPIGNSQK